MFSQARAILAALVRDTMSLRVGDPAQPGNRLAVARDDEVLTGFDRADATGKLLVGVAERQGRGHADNVARRVLRAPAFVPACRDANTMADYLTPAIM
jgi:hypothetical protein